MELGTWTIAYLNMKSIMSGAVTSQTILNIMALDPCLLYGVARPGIHTEEIKVLHRFEFRRETFTGQNN